MKAFRLQIRMSEGKNKSKGSWITWIFETARLIWEHGYIK